MLWLESLQNHLMVRSCTNSQHLGYCSILLHPYYTRSCRRQFTGGRLRIENCGVINHPSRFACHPLHQEGFLQRRKIMLEKIFKKQEKVQDKVQEKIQKQQKLNDKDCRELTDEELEQVVGGVPAAMMVSPPLA